MTSDVSSRILYLSGNCAVVNKLSGEAVEGAGPGMGDMPQTLAAALAAATGPSPHDALALPVAVHRLDVPVSGCAAFALTQSALRFLNAAFSGGASFGNDTAPAIEKHYWAIVETPPDGTPVPDAGELVHWLRFDPLRNKSIAYNKPEPGRKKAVLRYRLVGRGRHYLFFDIELITGRHHQIRSQLARLRLHIKGDLKYGARRSEPGGGIRLHARSLVFPDPAGTGERISVIAEPPLMDNLWLAFEQSVL
jgi:23S rRNA pseudouridine1911/1915/1917 synthase